MNNITNTSKRLPIDLLMDSIMMGGASKAVEASEKQGQKELVSSSVLPREYNIGCKNFLETYGVIFGKVCEDDSLFQEVTLPEGWKLKGTDHSMWSKLYDDRDRERASIFYKAAFYDRKAFISLSTRFTIDTYGVDGLARILDGGVEFRSESFIVDDFDSRVKAYNKCENWLDENYPLWKSYSAYWD